MTPAPISKSSTDLRVQSETQSEGTTLQPDLAISVRNLSKMYPLYADPRDRLKQSLWYVLPGFLRRQPRQFYEEFWALRDISFAVKGGETIGIIGRNGSGKSTLLQLIAGTLTPTHGEIEVQGRAAALLELGSGFNPEFTGRENVYLNGSIWGLAQAEIDDIFEEITNFANIGQFIDQPVKLYSSGMFVRLAFAVQAFVPKEIFIVDEALSVGDEAFQRKCMVRLEKFREEGGTVLLVSHDTQTIVRQCERCLLLSRGELLADGPSKAVTDLYHKLLYSDAKTSAKVVNLLRQSGLRQALDYTQVETDNHAQPAGQAGEASSFFTGTLDSHQSKETYTETVDWFDPNMPQPDEIAYSNGGAKITDLNIYNDQHQQVNVLVAGRRYRLSYWVEFYRDAHDVGFGIMLKTIDGLDVAGISSKREQYNFERISTSTVIEVSFSIRLNIAPGTYFLNIGVDGSDATGERTYLHRRVDMRMIRVLPPDSREIYGIAYLEPSFTYTFKPKKGSPLPKESAL